MPTPQELVRQAVHALLEEDGDLLVNDVAERTIANRLSAHLQPLFPDWKVDCEYNRDMDTVKRLRYAIDSDGQVTEREVNPDIIIHRRRTPDNLVVIELKKTTNQETDDKDLRKLAAFVDQLAYANACFLRLVAGSHPPAIAREHWVVVQGPE